MSDNLQAGMDMAPKRRRGQGQNAAWLLFLRCLRPESIDRRFPLLITTVSRPHSRTVALPPCLSLYIINSLEVDEAVVCLHQRAQPT
jgi:hypothetical protein